MDCYKYVRLVILTAFVVLCLWLCECEAENNGRPVIGILMQKTSPELGHYGDYYLFSAYVKFVEQAGALAVPVRVNETDKYYDELFSRINGVIFPGGGVSLVKSGYAHAGQKLFQLSIEVGIKPMSHPVELELGFICGCDNFSSFTVALHYCAWCMHCKSLKRFLCIINSIILPGGHAGPYTYLHSQYVQTAKAIYRRAVKANNKGDFFPILGICLGFELLTVLTTGSDLLTKCDGEDLALSLNVTPAFRDSRFFRGAPTDVITSLEQWNVTYNNHQYCMATKTFDANKKLTKFYTPLSTNIARNGAPFVSTMEARDFPFYGTQWHPEKNAYLWSTTAHVNHTLNAVRVTQYISNFFISEARKSNHRFPNDTDLAKNLIFNYQPVFVGLPSLHNIYFFNHSTGVDKDWDWLLCSLFTQGKDCRRNGQRCSCLNSNLILLLLVVLVLVIAVVAVPGKNVGSSRDLRQEPAFNEKKEFKVALMG